MTLKGDAGKVAANVALDDDRARVHELSPQLVQLRHLARPQEHLRVMNEGLYLHDCFFPFSYVSFAFVQLQCPTGSAFWPAHRKICALLSKYPQDRSGTVQQVMHAAGISASLSLIHT